jgi:hypothetical protein
MHNEQLHDLYSPNQILRGQAWRKSQVGDVACMGEKRRAYMVFMGKPEGKRSL